MSWVRSPWFWLIVAGVLVLLVGIIAWAVDWLSATWSVVLIAVGVLLAAVGGFGLWRRGRRDEEKEVGGNIRKIGQKTRGKIQALPYYGTATGRALGTFLVSSTDLTLRVMTAVNNLTIKTINLGTKAVVKIRRTIVMVIISAVLSVLTSGVGSGVVGGLLAGQSVSSVAGTAVGTVGSNLSSTSVQALGQAIGTELLKKGVEEGTNLAISAGTTGVSKVANTAVDRFAGSKESV